MSCQQSKLQRPGCGGQSRRQGRGSKGYRLVPAIIRRISAWNGRLVRRNLHQCGRKWLCRGSVNWNHQTPSSFTPKSTMPSASCDLVRDLGFQGNPRHPSGSGTGGKFGIYPDRRATRCSQSDRGLCGGRGRRIGVNTDRRILRRLSLAIRATDRRYRGSYRPR